MTSIGSDRRTRSRRVLGIAFAMSVMIAMAGLAAADTRVWTSQADFLSGSLFGLDATTLPGSLTLERNLTTFSPYPGNPVFSPSVSGWDSSAVIPYTVLKVAGSWVMWYTGTNSSSTGIGRATSPDGLHWTRNPTTPLLTSADWPIVLYEAGIYKMWYQHAPGAYMPMPVYYATSTDGISWTPFAGNPVFSPSASGFDSFIVTAGGVVHDATGYRMWYSGNDGSALTYSVGLATSPDGTNWSRYSGNPIITPPFGGWWDSERVLPCNVLLWNGKLLMAYVGADNSFVQRIALATSTDGIHWTPFSAPTLDLGPSGSWDDAGLSRMALVMDGGTLLMWYGGTQGGGTWQTGLATGNTYAPVGTFVSAVFDSGNPNTTWVSIAWTGSTPMNTGIGTSLEVGNSSTPDQTWTLSSPSVNSTVMLKLPKARYARVLVAMVTLDPSQTPTLDSLTVTYTPPVSPEFGGLGLGGFVLLVGLIAAAAAAFVVVTYLVLRGRRGSQAPVPQNVVTPCPQCGSPVPAGNLYCGRCGATTEPAANLGPPKG